MFFLKLQRGIFGSALEGVILVSRIKKNQPYNAIHAVHSAFSSLSCDKADLLRWWWWLWPWSERRPLWSCTLPQRQSKWSQTEVHQWWPPAKIEKPQSQRLKGLSDLEQCRHSGQQKQIKKENQKNLTQKQPPFTVKEVLSTHSLRHLTWNLNNKCQAVWMEDKKRFYRHKKLNQELFLSEEKLLHPTRHTLNPWTKQTNQVNQNITSVSVLQRHLMDAHGTGIKETNSLRFNRFYLFICWIWIFFLMNFDWIVSRASTREAFTVAHRHTHTKSHTRTGVWTHRQPDQEQDSKNSYWWPAAGAGDSLRQTASDPV